MRQRCPPFQLSQGTSCLVQTQAERQLITAHLATQEKSNQRGTLHPSYDCPPVSLHPQARCLAGVDVVDHDQLPLEPFLKVTRACTDKSCEHHWLSDLCERAAGRGSAVSVPQTQSRVLICLTVSCYKPCVQQWFPALPCQMHCRSPQSDELILQQHHLSSSKCVHLK